MLLQLLIVRNILESRTGEIERRYILAFGNQVPDPRQRFVAGPARAPVPIIQPAGQADCGNQRRCD